MANNLPARLSDLTFGGFDCQRADLSLHLDIVSGLNDGRAVRGEDTVIPSAEGRVPRSRVGDTRELLLVGWVQGAAEATAATEALRLASFQQLADDLEAAFDNRADPATLTGTALDGSTRSIEARALSIVWSASEVFGRDDVSITLLSVEPEWTVDAAS